MTTTDPVIEEMIAAGAMNASEKPFDESANEFVDNKEEGFTIPHTLKLKNPFSFGEREIKEIVFKNRLTVDMIMHLQMGISHQYGHYVPVVSQMTGESSELIKKLSPIDFVDCIMIVTFFFVG